MTEAELLQRKLAREQQARRQAEALLEQKSLELYGVNQKLQEAAEQLERRVKERTSELAKVNTRLERQAMESRLLHHVVAMAAETDSLELALQHAVDTVCEAIGWPVGDALLPAQDGTGELIAAPIWHSSEPGLHENFRRATLGSRFAPGVGLPGRIAQSGEPLWIDNILEDANFPRSKLCRDLTLRGAFGFPIKIAGEVVAVLEFFSASEVAPDQDLLNVMRSVGEQLGRVFERKRAEAARADLDRRLIEASRQAGMAEVATSVLHNVGNVLNSVNISASVVVDRLRAAPVSDLVRVGGMLQEAPDPGAFLTTDDRGKLVPRFLGELGRRLLGDQHAILEELNLLVSNVGHIKQIVSAQQSFARVAGVTEETTPDELVELALRLSNATLARHAVRVVRESKKVGPLLVDKHRVLQVLVNLMSNAAHAMSQVAPTERTLTVRSEPVGVDRVRIAVRDRGMGIAAHDLTRVFAHGFTTKKEGHGFGLHASALAAGQMGGFLVASSDGPGHGATFTLELPLKPTE